MFFAPWLPPHAVKHIKTNLQRNSGVPLVTAIKKITGTFWNAPHPTQVVEFDKLRLHLPKLIRSLGGPTNVPTPLGGDIAICLSTSIDAQQLVHPPSIRIFFSNKSALAGISSSMVI